MKNLEELILIRKEIKEIDEKLAKLYGEGFKINQVRIEDLEAIQLLLKEEREELIARMA